MTTDGDTREIDRRIAEALGYTVTTIHIPESNFMHYTIGPTNLHMQRGSERGQSVPHYSTDANALLLLLREWPDDLLDAHGGSLDDLGAHGILDALLKGEYEKLAQAWLIWKQARAAARAVAGEGE